MGTDLRRREFHVHGEYNDLAGFGLDMAAVRRLFSMAEPSELYWANKGADPATAWDIMVGDEVVTLWLGSRKISEVQR